MKQLLLFLSLLCASCIEPGAVELKVFQFNIWQEGTQIEGGFDLLADHIIQSDADFVTFSEVRNYNSTRFCDRITEALQQKGATYYSFYSYDSGLLSRYPIVDSMVIFPERDDQGSAYKLVADVHGTRVSVYTAHLDYRNCAYYDVKGYDGSTWEERESERDVNRVLEINRRSKRDDAMAAILKDAKKDIEQGNLVIIGGDFNEPSHLDWIESTKDMFDRQGLVVEWSVSSMLEKAGYIDSYRHLYPNAATHPGVTYPADCPEKELSALTWAPLADERERIDFIHFYPDPRLSLAESTIIGPRREIIRNQRVDAVSYDNIYTPSIKWPSDHKGLLTTFKINK